VMMREIGPAAQQRILRCRRDGAERLKTGKKPRVDVKLSPNGCVVFLSVHGLIWAVGMGGDESSGGPMKVGNHQCLDEMNEMNKVQGKMSSSGVE
jgi:hypothetical protein